ncbi:amidase domain-containing protein [Arcanobacterium canis]
MKKSIFLRSLVASVGAATTLLAFAPIVANASNQLATLQDSNDSTVRSHDKIQGEDVSRRQVEVNAFGGHYKLDLFPELVDPHMSFSRYMSTRRLEVAKVQTLSGLPPFTMTTAPIYSAELPALISGGVDARGGALSVSDQHNIEDVLEMSDLIQAKHVNQDIENDIKSLETMDDLVSDRGLQLMEEIANSVTQDTDANQRFAAATEQKRLLQPGETFKLYSALDAGFNAKRAIDYANRYAEKPNPKVTTYHSDCTNFVSQAMAAGSTPMSPSWNNGGFKWSWLGRPTRSWINAQAFANYFGLTRATNDLATFTKRANVGSPVGLKNDVRVYHIGFVVGKAGRGTYGNKSYQDIKIAQHSKNYVAWLTNRKTTLGWLSARKWVTR